ncbi:Homoserine O-acetyltransferase [Sodalis praecaptivus]
MTLLDNVRAQHRLIFDHWQIDRLALVAGWSMGAMQGYQWAALYPDAVGALLAVCGSAKCWPLNQVFLSGIAAALQTDPLFQQGSYTRPPLQGLAAFGRCYAGWAYSAAFYRQHLYRQLNFPTREALLHYWEQDHQGRDANDLLCMLHSWQTANIADNAHFGGDCDAAMAAISARTIVMPCTTDSYFTLEEAEMECGLLPRGNGARWRHRLVIAPARRAGCRRKARLSVGLWPTCWRHEARRYCSAGPGMASPGPAGGVLIDNLQLDHPALIKPGFQSGDAQLQRLFNDLADVGNRQLLFSGVVAVNDAKLLPRTVKTHRARGFTVFLPAQFAHLFGFIFIFPGRDNRHGEKHHIANQLAVLQYAFHRQFCPQFPRQVGHFIFPNFYKANRFTGNVHSQFHGGTRIRNRVKRKVRPI